LRILLLALAILALGVSMGWGQQSTVQGIVTDAGTSQPLTGANVVVEQGGKEVRSNRTDRNGLYQIGGLPAGAYQLRIMQFGYASHVEPIDLASGQRLTANRGLRPDPLQLEGVAFASPSSGAVRREMGRQSITVQDLKRIPTPVGGDMVGYLQTLPGVVTTGDRGGQLLIRGGTPSENMVLMDGMLVYQPFHITGFSSVFPADLVASAEFFPGGFPPRYSGRVSSVLDVRMRDGSPDSRALTASVSPFLAEVIAEGPLREKGGAYSYIVSASRSLIEQTSPWLLGQEQPLSFNSYYAKLSSVGKDGASRCSVTGLRSRDSGGLDPQDRTSRVGWTNLVIGGRCASLAGDVFIDVRAGFSRLRGDAITRGASELTSSANRLFFDADASRSIGRMRLDFGGFSHFKETSYDLAELFSQKRQTDGFAGLGVYSEVTVPIGNRFRVLPGATATWYPQTYAPTLEPRFRASWQPRGVVEEELSAAVGLYTQPVAGFTDRRDAGSIFTAWGRPLGDTQIRALHAQMSWQQSLGGGLSWSLDGYYRRMYNLPVTTWSTVATFTTELAPADGRTHGADTRVELRRGPFYGFAGYGYSWTEYEAAQEDFGLRFGEPVQFYHPSHDRRHQVNALASLKLGRYTLAGRWEYGSGFPFTRPLGFEELFDFRNSLPNVGRTYGQTRVLLDRPYNGRLPPIHRLDVSAERTFGVFSHRVQLQAGVINAYDQTNIFYYDVFTNRRIDQLPFAPYASLKLQPK
jgi:hypothetical protein